MAVTESKGNGYALYNGVKLPNIDTVWTDKEKYPYAAILWVAETDYVYLYLTTEKLCIAEGASTDSGTGLTNSVSLVLTAFEYVDGDYTKVAEDMNLDAYGMGFKLDDIVNLWSSYDILNTDNTIYLAASSPILLDGMNVIEWDGVTEGLEPFAGESLSNMWKIHSSLSEDERSGAVCAATISTLTTSEDVNIKHAADYLTWSELSSNTIKGSIFNEPLIWSHYNSEEDNGLYVLSIPVSDGYLYVSLLAYTPATTEPEEPEEPETPTVEKFPLMELIMGILSELNAGVYYTGGDD